MKPRREGSLCYLRGNTLGQRMPQSSAQSWAGPQGSLSTVSALYPFHNTYGWHLFFSWFYWKGSNIKGSDQPPVNSHHRQTEEPTVESVKMLVFAHLCSEPRSRHWLHLTGNTDPRWSSVTSTPGGGSRCRKAITRAADHGKIISQPQWQNLGQHPKDLVRSTG